MRHQHGQWALTPIGQQFVASLEIDITLLDTGSVHIASASFAHEEHTIIPSWAAPPRWAIGIERLHEKHPFDYNVFCMTRFPNPDELDKPVASAINVCREALSEFGLVLHLASDKSIEEDVLGNVGAYMWACKYGLGIVENRTEMGVNYNVAIELGAMIVTGRRCAILKDITVNTLPTDLAGQIYHSVDLEDQSSVGEAVRRWAESDLGLRRR